MNFPIDWNFALPWSSLIQAPQRALIFLEALIAQQERISELEMALEKQVYEAQPKRRWWECG